MFWLLSIGAPLAVLVAGRYLLGHGKWKQDRHYLRNWLHGQWERLQEWAERPVRVRRWWIHLRMVYRSGGYGEQGT